MSTTTIRASDFSTTTDHSTMFNTTFETTVIPLLTGNGAGTGEASPSVEPTYNPGDIAWILCSTALVFLMIPGVGYFYSGMAKSKSALSLILLCCISVAIVSVQWFIFGYSLAFSKSGSFFIGDFNHAFLMGVGKESYFKGGAVPELVFCIYQCMFAAITPALAIGSAAERNRFLPTCLFIFIWTTLVYDPIACWTWSVNGWSANLGGLDFAGGTPVHIASGAGALAFAILLGKRDDHKEEIKPHNMTNVFLGTALIWFGWFGFNGGSALGANMRAVMACIVTNLSASMGGLTWVFIDYFRYEKKFSALGFCAGVVAGLVCITPASGFVSPASSLVFGFTGAICCNFALKLKHLLNYDDALDVFAVHGVGGIVGNILTGIFAQKSIANLDGTEIHGGWLDSNWEQMGHQLADTFAGLIWSFVVTFVILYVMNKIKGLQLRASDEHETMGLDKAELGIDAYYFVNETITSSQTLYPGNGTSKGSDSIDVHPNKDNEIETTGL